MGAGRQTHSRIVLWRVLLRRFSINDDSLRSNSRKRRMSFCIDCDRPCEDHGRIRCRSCNARINRSNGVNAKQKQKGIQCEYCHEYVQTVNENGDCYSCSRRSPDPSVEEIWEMARQIRETRNPFFSVEDEDAKADSNETTVDNGGIRGFSGPSIALSAG